MSEATSLIQSPSAPANPQYDTMSSESNQRSAPNPMVKILMAQAGLSKGQAEGSQYTLMGLVTVGLVVGNCEWFLSFMYSSFASSVCVSHDLVFL